MKLNQIHLLILLAFLCLISPVLGQETEIENLIESESEFSDAHDLLEMLSEFEKNPLDINKASAKELAQLPWISDILAQKIVAYREQHHSFNSLNDLENLDGFDLASLGLLDRYLVVSPPRQRTDFSIQLKTRAIQKLQQVKGIEEGYYYNSPTKLYNRAIVNFGEFIRLGVLFEKDAGEKKFNDFNSYFLKYNYKSNSIIVGNYFLEFGQGLVFWNPYGNYKSNNPIYSAKKRARDLVEYTMVDENASLFGFASRICSKFYQTTLFYSTKKYDASINSENETVSSFYTSGYHRNQIEAAKTDQLSENLFGARLEFKPTANFSLGVTGYDSHYDKAINHGDPVRYRYDFQGRRNSVFAMDLNFTTGLMSLFGEVARSKSNGCGLVSGAAFDTKILDFAISFRNYAKNFYSLHGNSFGESAGAPQNEQGFYFGFRYKPTRNLNFFFYFDRFKFPWRTYSLPTPSQGKEILTAVKYKPMKKLWLYSQLKISDKPNSVSAVDDHAHDRNITTQRQKISARFQIDYEPFYQIQLRQRIEKCWVNYDQFPNFKIEKNAQYTGLILYQEIIFKLKNRATLSARLTFFDTEGYEGRLYQFERDLPGVLTNQMLYEKGTRWYIYAYYKINTVFKIYLKYSATHYYFRKTIGSQYDTIAGDLLNTMNLQIETSL